MLDILISWLKDIPKDFVVMAVAALPVFELRLSIPLGYYQYQMTLGRVFWLSLFGNFLPIIPILFLFAPVSNRLRKFRVWASFFDWLERRTMKRADLVQKYEALGLALFVALPIPGSGAWTGCLAATLFKIRFRYAFLAIVCGVILAGIIVSILCKLGMLGLEAVAR